MNTKHTPTPWIFDETWSLIIGPDKSEVAALHSGQAMHTKRIDRHVALDNAALICRAVNSHDTLVAALERVSAWIGCNVFQPELGHIDELKHLRAALAAAKEEK